MNFQNACLEEWVAGTTLTPVAPGVREPGASERADHAALAMRAAKKVRRARRRSQKEKIGHEVCRHLLSLLNAGPESGRPVQPLETPLGQAKPLSEIDERQMTIAF